MQRGQQASPGLNVAIKTSIRCFASTGLGVYANGLRRVLEA